jgi:hypothetical protein
MTTHPLADPDRPPYEAPQLIVLGTVTEITQVKAFNASDGASFFGAPEGLTS